VEAVRSAQWRVRRTEYCAAAPSGALTFRIRARPVPDDLRGGPFRHGASAPPPARGIANNLPKIKDFQARLIVVAPCGKAPSDRAFLRST